MKNHEIKTSTKPQRMHTYDLDNGYVRVTEDDNVISEEPFTSPNTLRFDDNGKLVPHSRGSIAPSSLSTAAYGLNATAHIEESFQESASAFHETRNNLVKSLEPVLKTQERLRDSFIEPTRRFNERMVEIVDGIKPLNEAIVKNTQVLSSMNTVGITLGQSLSELQNGVFEQFRAAATQSYVPFDIEAPSIVRNRIDLPLAPVRGTFDNDYTNTLKIDSFEPITNDEYSLTTTVSSIATYQPLIYERLETVEMRVQSVEHRQQKTQETMETVLSKVEEGEEMLDELITYFKQNHTNTFSLKNIRYNAKFSRLSIHDEKTTFRKDSYQDTLCSLLFSKKERIGEPWSMEELIKYFAGMDVFSLAESERKQLQRRIIDAAHNINANIAKQTRVVSKFLIITNQQIVVNPNLLD